jgi:hypothetical protein
MRSEAIIPIQALVSSISRVGPKLKKNSKIIFRKI